MDNKAFELVNGWRIATDYNNEGITSGWEKSVPTEAVDAYVPSIIQQFFPNYHGAAYYWCRFAPELTPSETDRVILRFGGVDYKADVWLNGVFLGSEESPESPFTFDVTDVFKNNEENLLAVRVLNPCDREIDGINLLRVPHRNRSVVREAGSNLNSGGIWYGVTLSCLPCAFISDAFAIPDSKSGEVKIRVTLDSALEVDGVLSVKVTEKADGIGCMISESFPVGSFCGAKEQTVSVTLKNYKIWDIDDPNLYRLELVLKTKYGEHCVCKNIGFREFFVKDGFFYLNGRKIFLKSAHTGNCFPIGQNFPSRTEQIRKDLIYAKSSGFNMLRSIAGVFRPEQIDIADEIGLLLFEECLASWCLGNSNMCDWNDDESYESARLKRPEMPLGDEKTMLDRWRAVTEKMIVRDRSHPSVVVWGLLNETKNNGVFRAARDFLPRARELDPSRFIVLNSGRFDYDLSIGSASNPYSGEWENTWSNDGHPEVMEKALAEGKNRNWYVGDNHFYGTAPMPAFDKKICENMGKGTALATFKSEFGIGPIFNVIDELRHFKQYGERLDLDDSAWLEYQSEALEKDFFRLGLDRVFAFPERLLKESQRNSAMDRRLVFDMFRANPRISGFSLTGLLDHGMCGEGLWTLWRHWKPEVFDAVSDGWEPLRFCLFAPHNTYNDLPMEINVVLANEGILKSGEYLANIAVIGGDGCVWSKSVKFCLDENELAVPVYNGEIEVRLPKGRYTLVAELDEGAARGAELDFEIKDRNDNRIDEAFVYTAGLSREAVEHLENFGVSCAEWSGECDGAVLVGMVDAKTASKAIDAANNGASVFFLDVQTFFDSNEGGIDAAKAVISDLKRCYYHDWLYHKECAFNDSEMFKGFNNGLARLRDFENVFPSHIFRTDVTPDYPLCPAFQTGYFAVKDAYMLAYAMLGHNFGRGKVFFSSFEILKYLGTPTADKLLSNTVRYLTK